MSRLVLSPSLLSNTIKTPGSFRDSAQISPSRYAMVLRGVCVCVCVDVGVTGWDQTAWRWCDTRAAWNLCFSLSSLLKALIAGHR